MKRRFPSTKVLQVSIAPAVVTVFVFIFFTPPVSRDASPKFLPVRIAPAVAASVSAKGHSMALRWRRRVPGTALVIAHRGYSALYADNSLEGFEQAIAAGADLIETDVRMSSDNVLVISHDPDIDFFTDVHELSAAELAKQSVMKLDQVLKMARNRTGVLLDIKLDEPDFPALVLKEVKRFGMERQVVFGLRELAQVHKLRKLAPDVVILGFFRDYSEYPAFFAAGGDIARLWEEDINERTLKLARGPARDEGDRPVWVTTRLRARGESAGEIDPPRLRKLMEMGIDGFLVNDPVQALRVRAEFERRYRRLGK